jgi:hypothetical protein
MDAIAVDGTADFHSYNYDDSNRISMQGTANKPHLDKLWLENDDTISGGNAFRLLLWRNVNDSADSGTADLHLIAVWLSNGVNGS